MKALSVFALISLALGVPSNNYTQAVEPAQIVLPVLQEKKIGGR